MISLPSEHRLPTGTVTFLFTDIQGSTPLWESQPEKMAEAQQVHNQALHQAIAANGGVVFEIVGDAFAAAFPTAPSALQAAIDGQRALQTATWNDLGPIRVRMGLHTGTADLDPHRQARYAASHHLNRVSRVMSAGQGGQILVSQETTELVRRNLPQGVTLKDLGQFRLKGMIQPEHLYQVVIPGLRADFPLPAGSLESVHNLLIRLTSFIGRQEEIEAVCELVVSPDIRLLTITGVGGTGKTSLAIQAGWKLLESFPDGVFLVDLAPIKDPGLVLTAVAGVLSVHELAGKSLPAVLEEHLAPRRVLLILDNFEQVIAAGNDLVDLLKAAPHVKVIVTSRELLQLSPEHHFPLSPLPIPPPHSSLETLQENEAVRLFTERAQVIQPNFRLTADNGPDIAEICRRLDGLPLAIELITARLRLFSPQQLLHQLSNSLGLLSGGWRDLPPRHQTMRSAIAWSYTLLVEDEKRLFYSLAIFPGSFSPEAVEAIFEGGGLDILAGMESLLDKSLVNHQEIAGQLRFWLFETLRTFGMEALVESGERETIERSHAVYYAELATIFQPSLGGLNYPLWDLELNNLRAAFNWAIENQDAELCFKLGGNFFSWEKQVGEGRQLITRALTLPNLQAHDIRRWSLLYSASVLTMLARDFANAGVLIDELGIVSQKVGDAYKIWEHKFIRSVLLIGLGEYQSAIELLLADRNELNDFDYGVSHVCIASSELQLRHLEAAKEYIQDAQFHLKRAGEWTYPYIVDCLSIQGYIALEESMPGEAAEYFRQAFKLALELSVQARVGIIYYGLGGVALQTGDLVIAANWMSLAVTIEKTTGSASRTMLDSLSQRYLSELQDRLDPTLFNTNWQAGQQLTLDQAIAYGEEYLLTL
jgi:predicted ATPase/class 3 adenylate cyclase